MTERLSQSPITYLESLDLMEAIHNLATQGDAIVANTRSQVAQRQADRQQAIERQKSSATSQMQRLMRSQNERRMEFERDCERAINAIRDNANRTISDSADIRAQLNEMDSQLNTHDRWYRKFRAKNIARFEGTVAQSYQNCDDAFNAMQRIRDEFAIVSEKYRTRMWPAIVDGIHYLFSSTRREDYETLLSLKCTIDAFSMDVKSNMDSWAQAAVAALRNDHDAKRAALKKRLAEEREAEQAELDRKLAIVSVPFDEGRAYDGLAKHLDVMLEKALPRQLVSRAEHTLRAFDKLYGTPHIEMRPKEGVLYVHAFVYPLQRMCKEPALRQMIEGACGTLASGGDIIIPFASTVGSYVSPYVSVTSGDAGLNMALGTMYSIIGNVGAGRLRVSACDIDAHGNSLELFYGMRAKVPEIFDNEFLTNEQAVYDRIAELGEYVESTTQLVLGSEYANIWDYADAHPDMNPRMELLVLIDFPTGVDERQLSVLRNVIVRGPVCGVYVVMCESRDRRKADARMDESIEKLKNVCNLVDCDSSGLSTLGMRYVHPELPSKADVQRFTSRYMLVLAQLRNQGIGFPAYLNDLVSSKSKAETERAIRDIAAMMSDQAEHFGVVPDIDLTFPAGIPLGFTHYPYDVFDDVPGQRAIMKAFGDGNGAAKLPLMLDFERSGSILVEYDAKQFREAERLSHYVVWSFLSCLPPTKVNVCVVDIEKKGMGIAPFLDFRKMCPDVFDGVVHTNPTEVRERLARLSNFIDTTIQDKLGARYENLLAYNRALPSNSEPFTLVVVNDYPTGFDSSLANMLADIIKNGARCGVYAIVNCNHGVVPSGYDDFDSLRQILLPHCEHIELGNGTKLMPYELSVSFGGFEVTPSCADAFARDYQKAYVKAQNRGLSFADVADKELFGGSAAESLEIPIGIADGGSVANLEIGRGSSHHVLIAGATGSGKSTLLHTIIMSAMTRYSPDQLHLYLMDFKSGTEFKVYDERHLPHVRLLALDAMQEFGESILENLVAEMQGRSQRFKNAGVSKLSDYLEQEEDAMPRILVIMDEFQVLFNDRTNRKVANHCAELTKKIVTEGRSYGIHLIMATQSMRDLINLSLSSGTIEQMRIRIGLKCGERDCVSLFGDDNATSALAGMAGPKGTAVMNLEFTQEDNTRLRVSYCKPKDQRALLDKISRATSDVPCERRTFEGSRTPELIRLLPGIVSENAGSRFPKIMVGEPIKVAPPLEVSFDRRRRHNTVVCGGNPDMADMLANLYILQSALHPRTQVWCVDGEHMLGESDSEDLYEYMKSRFEDFHVPDTRGEIIGMVHSLGDSLSQRRRHSDSTNVVVVIKNLQYLDIVCSMLRGERIDESQYMDEEPEPVDAETSDNDTGMIDFGLSAFMERRSSTRTSGTQNVSSQLIQLMSDGGTYGIHFVVTAMDFQTIKEYMYFNESLLNKFPERLVFSLKDSDCDRMVEGVSVEDLPENIVVYTDSTKNTYQVKPFAFPGVDELSDCINVKEGV